MFNCSASVRRKAQSSLPFQVLHSLEGVGVMVLAKLWAAFLPERRAVAGGLDLHPVSGQPGNAGVYLG